MAKLLITTEVPLGPLAIEVVGVREGHPLIRSALLSAGQPRIELQDVPPGDYAVIATRPSGETHVQRITVGAQDAVASFEVAEDDPLRRVTNAVRRGLVPTRPSAAGERADALLRARGAAHGIPLLTVLGVTGRAMMALNANMFVSNGQGRVESAQPREEPSGGRYVVLCWDLRDGRWRRSDGAPPLRAASGLLSIDIKGTKKPAVQAYAVLDETGFGPVVIVPPFREGLLLSFFAEGLTAGAAERMLNPSSIRVPVAAAVPHEARLADLLAGLNAPALPAAATLWTQNVGEPEDHSAQALDMLLHKRRDPAAAVLGAHFLARFRPTSAPIDWLENLTRLLPDMADPPTLLAWRLIADGEGGRDVRRRIRDCLHGAAHRPACLFARTRVLLTQATRLYGPHPRSRKVGPTKYPRKPRPGDFLNVAAEACGLEAFWGSRPNRPGRPETPDASIRRGVPVRFP